MSGLRFSVFTLFLVLSVISLKASQASGSRNAISLAGAMTTPHSSQVRKFEGLMNTGFTSPDGSTLPVFFDPARRDFQPSDTNKAPADELLKAVASEGSGLKTPVEGMEAIAGALALGGKKEEGAIIGISLRIVVYPRKGTLVRGRIRNPATFSAGPLKSLKEVIEKFGEPTELELWSTATTRGIGLDGIVQWWGEVGMAASKSGTVTHVLVRQAPKK